MSLYVRNTGVASVTLAAPTTLVVVVAAGSLKNVTSELRGLTGAQYTDLENQRLASGGTLSYAWNTPAEYSTTPLVTVDPWSGGVLPPGTGPVEMVLGVPVSPAVLGPPFTVRRVNALGTGLESYIPSGGSPTGTLATQVFWVSLGADPGGDGSFNRPFDSIQHGLTAISALPRTGETYVLMIAPGNYGEGLVIDDGSGQHIVLCALGGVRTTSLEYYFDNTPVRPAPGLWLTGMGSDCATSTGARTTGIEFTGGGIEFSDGAGSTTLLFGGTFRCSDILATGVGTSSIKMVLHNASVTGEIAGSRVTLNADNSYIRTTNVGTLGRLTHCSFSDVQFASSLSSGIYGVGGLFGCSVTTRIISTEPGPPPVNLDGSTWAKMVADGATLVGCTARFVDYGTFVVTTTQRLNQLAPRNGQTVFDTNTRKTYAWDATNVVWAEV